MYLHTPRFLHLLACTILILVLSACSAHLKSQHVSGNIDQKDKKQETHGLFYTLPRTVVKVSIPITLTEIKAGEYSNFAALFFYGEKRQQPGKKLTLKRATFSSRGEPDPTQVYYMEVRGRGAIEQSLTFSFTEEGGVTGLKAEVTNQTADVVLAGVSGVTSILTKAMLGTAAEEVAAKEDIDLCSKPAHEIDDHLFETHFLDCFLESRQELRWNFAQLQHAAQNQENPATANEAQAKLDEVKEAYVQVVCDSNDKCVHGPKRQRLNRALQTFDLIRDLQKNINDALLNPQNNLAGFEPTLQRAEATIKALTQEFLGKTVELASWTGIFEVIPDSCDKDRAKPCDQWTSKSLFTYETGKGICSPTAYLLGAPPPPKLKVPATECPLTQTVKLHLAQDPTGDQLVTRIANNYTRPEEAGLHYLVPARMAVSLLDSSDEKLGDLGGVDLMIAQHGIVAAMPSKMGGKAFTHDVTFYDASGALKSYNLVSKPLVDKGMVDSLSASTNALLDARNKQLEAEKEAADPLNQAKKEAELLKALLDAQNACAELENPPEECEQ